MDSWPARGERQSDPPATAYGITYERLAEEFDLSVRCVKQIVYKGQEKIFKHIPG